jgi:hypothetical protein
MDTSKILLSVVALLMNAAAVDAQSWYMNDTSSIYSDGYADESYVFGTGNTLGAYPIHWYIVDVTVTSPLGRTASQAGSYGPGDVSTSTALDWNVNDFGMYLITSTHRLYCWSALQEFYMDYTQTGRTPTAPPCTESTLTCKEFNQEAPLGTMKNHDCRYSDYCCGPDYGEPYAGGAGKRRATSARASRTIRYGRGVGETNARVSSMMLRGVWGFASEG